MPPRTGTEARDAGRLRLRVVVAAALGGFVASCAATNDTAPGASEGPQTAGMAIGQPGLAARRASAQAEIGEARRALDVASEACDSACPALADLRVGVGHLCRVTDTKDDDRICKEARKDLEANAERLQSPCGACKPAPEAGPDDASDDVP